MNCNQDCQQGKACYCKQPRRLSYRGKVLLAYSATVAVAIGAAVAMSYLIAPGA